MVLDVAPSNRDSDEPLMTEPVKSNSGLRDFAPFLLSWFCAAVLCVGIWHEHTRDLKNITDEFHSRVQTEAQTLAQAITHKFELLYQGLRTIARLSGTRNIDRHGETLDAGTRQSIQEVYNNLYSNITLSEVYLVPHDFNPDEVDATTGKNQQPIATFDEFIVGRHALAVHAKQNAAQLEEIEIYEYRLMARQLAWLQRSAPNEDVVQGLAYPAISSGEAITCDNSFFVADRPDDKDRSGIVYSVPFFGGDGHLRGMVSGVLLTRVIQKLLPNGNYVLFNGRNDYMVTAQTGGNPLATIAERERDSQLAFSTNVDLPIKDAEGDWHLWAGVQTAQLDSLPIVLARKETTGWAFGAVVAVTLALNLVFWSQRKQQLLVQQHTHELELKVEGRTAELAEANRKLDRANRSKSAFLSRTSHELRTPLNAIIGYSELLLEDAQAAGHEETASDCIKIHRAAQHLLALINSILDISRIESGKELISLATEELELLVHDVATTVRPLLSRHNNKLRVEVAEDVGAIHTDTIKLRQVLLNVLSNAAKFTKDGLITLAVHREQVEGELNIVFVVTDTGIGMTKEQMEYLFEEFHQASVAIQRDFGGSGLGLAISRRLLDLLGGHIAATSEFGKGTTFTVAVPVSLQRSSAPSEVAVA